MDHAKHITRLNIFISYSRNDIEFADELVAGLEVMGFAPSIDRNDIVEGEDWQKRLGGLIADADTIVFVISPNSAKSDMCHWEVNEAARLSKRILPVLWQAPGEHPVPEQLSALHYTRFDEGHSFMAGLKALTTTLNTDLDWLREHTRLLARAREWDEGGRPTNRLLSGADIREAKDWIARRPRNAPEPTSLHFDFVKSSETWEAEQQGERDRQLAERERLIRESQAAQDREVEAQAARDTAQKEALAHAKEAEQRARSVARRTFAGLAGALVLAAVAGWFGYQSNLESLRAEEEAKRAEAAGKSMVQLVAGMLESDSAVTRREMRALIAKVSATVDAVVFKDAMLELLKLRSKIDSANYRIQLGVLVGLSNTRGGWIATNEQRKLVQELARNPRFNDVAFRRAVLRMLSNMRPPS